MLDGDDWLVVLQFHCMGKNISYTVNNKNMLGVKDYDWITVVIISD